MKKTLLIGGIAAAIIGSVLIWSAGSGRDHGVEGWETLNARVAQAIEGGPEAGASLGRDGGQADDGRGGAAGEAAGGKAGEAEEGGGSPAQGAGQGPGKAGAAASPVPAAQSGAGGSLPGNESVPAAAAAGALASAEGKVNVNTAGLSELTGLPGIGEKKAQAILDYRKQHGPFRSLSDLGNVKGIGPKMLEKLKPCVVF